MFEPRTLQGVQITPTLKHKQSSTKQCYISKRFEFVKENGQNVTKYRNMQAVEAVEASLKGLGLSKSVFDIFAESRLLNL